MSWFRENLDRARKAREDGDPWRPVREDVARAQAELAEPPAPGRRLSGAQLDALGWTFGCVVGGTVAALLSATGLIPLAWWFGVGVVVYGLMVCVCRLYAIASVRD